MIVFWSRLSLKREGRRIRARVPLSRKERSGTPKSRAIRLNDRLGEAAKRLR